MSDVEDPQQTGTGRRRFARIPEILLIIVIVVGLIWGTRPRVGSGPASSRFRCMNNMKSIALAMTNYHADYGCFPPAYVADENGRPMHSWRVLLLPYLDMAAMHRQYDFDEPWNGPNNSKLGKFVPAFFRCPVDDDDDTFDTSYVVVVGPETLFPGTGCTKQDDVTDGLDQTIVLVEMADSGIHWMEPRDLHVSQMTPSFNEPPGRGISSHHGDVVVVSFANGRVESLPKNLDSKFVRAYLTINGGEDATDWYDER